MEVRRIISKEEEHKKKRRNQFIVGGVLVLLMVLSTLGYAFQGNPSTQNTSEEVIYNGYKFVPQSGFWVLQMGDFLFRFSYNPQQTENILGEFKLVNNYAGKPLYISSEDGLAESEIYANLDQVILRRQYACLEGENCTGGLPTKNCNDNFIIIKEDDISGIVQENNCVFIYGPRDNLVQLTDSFIYKIIGVK
ncbi:MAG: hypothetical protein AABW50_00810 [Nanoarchaeota archaeon]